MLLFDGFTANNELPIDLNHSGSKINITLLHFTRPPPKMRINLTIYVNGLFIKARTLPNCAHVANNFCLFMF